MSLREKVLARVEEWQQGHDDIDDLALAVAALVAEECADIALRATPDPYAKRIVGDAAHYIAAYGAIRRVVEDLK